MSSTLLVMLHTLKNKIICNTPNTKQTIVRVNVIYEKQNSEVLALLKTIALELKEARLRNNKGGKSGAKAVAATEIKKESTPVQPPKKERPAIDRNSEEYRRNIKKWNCLLYTSNNQPFHVKMLEEIFVVEQAIFITDYFFG